MSGHFFKKVQSCLLIGLAVGIGLSGCAPKLGSNDVSVHNAGEVSQTYQGVILSARSITIHASDASKPGAGALLGGVGGAALGSTIGQGKGRIIGATLGGLAAGAAGHFIEKAVTEQPGMEYQVRLIENGKLITVRQGADSVLAVGQKVFVIQSSQGGSRVIADNSK